MDSNHYDIVILTGDLNKLNCANIAEGLGLHQIINKPTRGNRILDIFYTNRPELFCTTVARSLVHSDHLSLLTAAQVMTWLSLLFQPRERK